MHCRAELATHLSNIFCKANILSMKYSTPTTCFLHTHAEPQGDKLVKELHQVRMQINTDIIPFSRQVDKYMHRHDQGKKNEIKAGTPIVIVLRTRSDVRR